MENLSKGLAFLLYLIGVNLIAGFAAYSLGLAVIKMFTRLEKASLAFDRKASGLAIYLGLLHFFIWLLFVMLNYVDASPEDQARLLSRLRGPYWYGVWLQAFICLLLSQGLRIPLLRRNILYRILFGLSYIFTVERLVILTTSLHKDYYTPSTFALLDPWLILLSFLIKGLFFFLICAIILFLGRFLNHKKHKPINGLTLKFLAAFVSLISVGLILNSFSMDFISSIIPGWHTNSESSNNLFSILSLFFAGCLIAFVALFFLWLQLFQWGIGIFNRVRMES